MHTHPMYICERCNFAHYHPLQYCRKCPGKLIRKEIPHPYSFKTEKDLCEHLTSQGLKYFGEYPAQSEEAK